MQKLIEKLEQINFNTLDIDELLDNRDLDVFDTEWNRVYREVFSDLYDKYGDDFNWYMIPFTQSEGYFVKELKKEIGSDHFLYDKTIYAVAKCESNDDVLYVTGSESGVDTYYVFHLTYSNHNSDGFPKYKQLSNVNEVKEFMELEVQNNL